MNAQAEVFTANLPADPGLLRDFRRQLAAWLDAASVTERARNAILLAAHEAAANAIEHAAAPVTVVGRVEPDVILIEVTSAGRSGRPPTSDIGRTGARHRPHERTLIGRGNPRGEGTNDRSDYE